MKSWYQILIPNFHVSLPQQCTTLGTKPIILVKVCQWQSNGFLFKNLIDWLSNQFKKWKSKPYQNKRKNILLREINGRVTKKNLPIRRPMSPNNNKHQQTTFCRKICSEILQLWSWCTYLKKNNWNREVGDMIILLMTTQWRFPPLTRSI